MPEDARDHLWRLPEWLNYDAATLERILHGLEGEHGMTSEEFMAAYRAGDTDRLAGLSGFTRHSWASFYTEWQELSEQEAQR